MKVLKKQSNSHDCFICGVDNPCGLHANFYEMEDGSLVSLFTYKSEHQSYPERTHGGMIAAMIDESIGRAVWINDPTIWACTIKLSIEYHAAVPYGVPLKCISSIDHLDKMTFHGSARIIDENGKLLARGEALYMRLSLGTISPGKHEIKPDDINVYIPDDIKEISF